MVSGTFITYLSLKLENYIVAGFVAILVTLADETIQYHRRKICI